MGNDITLIVTNLYNIKYIDNLAFFVVLKDTSNNRARSHDKPTAKETYNFTEFPCNQYSTEITATILLSLRKEKVYQTFYGMTMLLSLCKTNNLSRISSLSINRQLSPSHQLQQNSTNLKEEDKIHEA